MILFDDRKHFDFRNPPENIWPTVKKYSPDQARDYHGRFADESGGEPPPGERPGRKTSGPTGSTPTGFSNKKVEEKLISGGAMPVDLIYAAKEGGTGFLSPAGEFIDLGNSISHPMLATTSGMSLSAIKEQGFHRIYSEPGGFLGVELGPGVRLTTAQRNALSEMGSRGHFNRLSIGTQDTSEISLDTGGHGFLSGEKIREAIGGKAVGRNRLYFRFDRPRLIKAVAHTSASHLTPRIQAILGTLTAKLTRILAAMSGPIAAEVARLYRQKLKAMHKAEGEEEEFITLRDEILADVTLDLFEFEEALSPALRTVYQDALEEAYAMIGVDTTPLSPKINQAAIEYAMDRAAELVGKKWVNGELVDNPNAEWAITDSTRAMLEDDILQAFQEGWTPNELAQVIRDSEAFSAYRADMVARTEMAMAQVEGSLEAWRQSDAVTGKMSVLSNDHDKEDECDDAAGMGTIDVDDDFGGLGDPPYHPNCQCALVASSGEEE